MKLVLPRPIHDRKRFNDFIIEANQRGYLLSHGSTCMDHRQFRNMPLHAESPVPSGETMQQDEYGQMIFKVGGNNIMAVLRYPTSPCV